MGNTHQCAHKSPPRIVTPKIAAERIFPLEEIVSHLPYRFAISLSFLNDSINEVK